MKKTLTLTLLAVLLTACAAPTPSPTMTPFSTVPPSEVTAISTPNATLVATPTDAVSEAIPVVDAYANSDLDWKYIENHRLPLPETLNLNGVDIRAQFGFDSTIERFISTTQLHDGWQSDAGNSAETAFASYAQHVYYNVYVSNQKSAGNKDIPDFDTYMSWVSAAQKSGLAADYEKIAIWIHADTTVDDKYMPEKTKVIPMFKEGGEGPDGAIPLSSFEGVVVNASRVKNVKFYDNNPGYGGVGVSIYPDHRLVAYIGPNLSTPEIFSTYAVAASLSLVENFLSTGTTRIPGSGWGDTDLLEAISVKSGNHVSMFFQITSPETPNELRENR